jgi:dihydrodipicolinate synthase/N-acetylneuraminate lyase
MSKKISGVFVPMVTAFKPQDESFDEAGQRQVTNYLIENGVDGLIPSGSTGEFVAMSMAEQKRVNEVVVEEARGRVKVYCSTAAYRTSDTIELSKAAEKAGADGVMIVTPWYVSPNEDELYRHYAAVREAISIPIMLYHNPYFSTTLLTDKFMAKLFNDGVIDAVKERQADVFRQQNLRYLTNENFNIFYGFDFCAYESLSSYADGWVCGTGNLFPAENKKLFTLIKEGKLDEAKDYNLKKLRPYLDLYMTGTDKGYPCPWLSLTKEGLEMMGIHVGVARKPMLPLPDDVKQRLAKVLKEYRKI